MINEFKSITDFVYDTELKAVYDDSDEESDRQPLNNFQIDVAAHGNCFSISFEGFNESNISKALDFNIEDHISESESEIATRVFGSAYTFTPEDLTE